MSDWKIVPKLVRNLFGQPGAELADDDLRSRGLYDPRRYQDLENMHLTKIMENERAAHKFPLRRR